MADHPMNVLLVEDDDDHAMLIESSWSHCNGGARVTRCHDGGEAVDFFKARESQSPRDELDIVVLDLKMPKLNGFDVLGFLKTHPTFRKIPVVVLTTSDNESDRRRAYDLYANSYVVKPMDFKAFRKTVARLDEYWSRLNRRYRVGQHSAEREAGLDRN